jgi:hypothetical protein
MVFMGFKDFRDSELLNNHYFQKPGRGNIFSTPQLQLA